MSRGNGNNADVHIPPNYITPEGVKPEMSTLTDIKTNLSTAVTIEDQDHYNIINDDPEDPLNFSTARKWTMLFVVSLSSFIANYSAAAHLTAFVPMAAYFDVSIAAIANSVGISILGLGVGPFIWNPLARTIGRRPTYIISAALFVPVTFWLAFSKSYTSFAAARFFAGVMPSASQSLGSTTIADLFPKETRGDKVAFWSMFLVSGVYFAPLVGGFVTHKLAWQWVYYIVIMMSGVNLLGFIIFYKETLYIRHAVRGIPDVGITATSSPTVTEHHGHLEKGHGAVHFDNSEETIVVRGKRGAAWMPWQRPREFMFLCLKPFIMQKYIVMLVPSIYYATLFGWSVGLTIVVPQIYETPVAHGGYGFSGEMIGVTFMANFIGSLIGKFAGGILADKTVTFVANRRGGVREPEYRLWAMIPCLILLPAGLLTFGICIDKHTHWIGPLIGVAVYYVGLVSATGIIQTYVIDCYMPEAANGVSIFNFYKCVFSFAVPFFVFTWALKSGFTDAYIVQAMLSMGLGILLVIGFLIWGRSIRKWQGMPSHTIPIPAQ